MKKHSYLLVLFVFVFLLLCACVQEETQPISSAPDVQAFSSVPFSSVIPASSSVPASSTPATSAPPVTTAPPVTSVPATSAPATKPAPPVQLSTDWVVEHREIIPFEERFAEDVPFSSEEYPYIRRNLEWLVATRDGNYAVYKYGYDFFTEKSGIFHNDKLIYSYTRSCNHTGYIPLIADGQYAYFADSGEVAKENLLTGECSVLLKKGENIVHWSVHGCGKDTLCIFAVDKENNLRIFYRDLHSDAEKVLYEGKVPETPSEDLRFIFSPTTTLGTVRWWCMNPEFYAVLQAELANPDSQFKTNGHHDYSEYWDNPDTHPASIETAAFLCIDIQNHYNIPARIEYSIDPKTGELLADYGIIDSCERGSGDYNDHFNYENTWETPLDVLDSEPLEVSNLIKLTPQQAEQVKNDEYNGLRLRAILFSEFGNGKPYLNQDGKATKLADIEAREIASDPYYIYCITTDNTIVQISPDGSICNTIYTSNGVLDDLCYLTGSIYFKENDKVIRIDTITGTCSTILHTNGSMSVESFGEDGLYILVVQGLYNQQYFFHPDTGELEETGFI